MMVILSATVLKGIKKTISRQTGVSWKLIDDATALLFNRTAQGIGMTKQQQFTTMNMFDATFRQLGGKGANWKSFVPTEARQALARGNQFKRVAQSITGEKGNIKQHIENLKSSSKLHELPNEQEQRQMQAIALTTRLLAELSQIVGNIADTNMMGSWNMESNNETQSFIEESRTELLNMISGQLITEMQILHLEDLSPYANIFFYTGHESGDGVTEDMQLSGDNIDPWIYIGSNTDQNGAIDFINDIKDILV